MVPLVVSLLLAAAAGAHGAANYTVRGSIDVGTFENTIFYTGGTMYLLENIPCSYLDHAGQWFPQFAGHSYARIRELSTGNVVSNVTSTIGYGFVSAFADESGTVWLFGTPNDRCGRSRWGKFIQSWWSRDLVTWSTARAIDGPSTENVEVSAVPNPPASLPPHKYVMIYECFTFAVNNGSDLSTGWVVLPNTVPPPRAHCGGPSMRFNPLDQQYYIITGGNTIDFYRTKDFKAWEASPLNPIIKSTAGDALVAPYAGFPQDYVRKGFVPMSENWKAWDWNSNDADVCCMNSEVTTSYLVWGASTQGGQPHPPLDKNHSATNVIGTSTLPLPQLLRAWFP